MIQRKELFQLIIKSFYESERKDLIFTQNTLKILDILDKRIENFRSKYPLEFNDLVDSYIHSELSPENFAGGGIILVRNSYIPRYTVSFIPSINDTLDFDIWCKLAPKEGFIRQEKSYNTYSFKIRPDWTVVWTSEGIGGMERYGNDPFFTDVMNILIKLGIFSKELKLIKDGTLPNSSN